jgi:hypothetical protein
MICLKDQNVRTSKLNNVYTCLFTIVHNVYDRCHIVYDTLKKYYCINGVLIEEYNCMYFIHAIFK